MFLFDSKRLPLFRKALILIRRGLTLVNIVQYLDSNMGLIYRTVTNLHARISDSHTKGGILNCYKLLHQTAMLDNSHVASSCLAAKSTLKIVLYLVHALEIGTRPDSVKHQLLPQTL
jgi:hypothetical protein